MLRFLRVNRARHARLHVAERAGPGADIAQDHHRRVFFRPALADIWAGRFLTNSRELQSAHQRPGLVKSRTNRRFDADPVRSEEHTSELQYLMRNSYAVFCLK